MNAISVSREVVLVVDDSPATLGLLSESLERAGFTEVKLERRGERMDCLVEARKPL